MGRYAGAVHRYLLAALRDPEAAEELDQEFAVRFLRGDFHRADPARGRFRDFVKRALRNLMIDHRRARRPGPGRWATTSPSRPTRPPTRTDFDRRFVASWRAEMMSRAWEALARLQERTGQPYHTVLRLRVEHPDSARPSSPSGSRPTLGRRSPPAGRGWRSRGRATGSWSSSSRKSPARLTDPDPRGQSSRS